MALLCQPLKTWALQQAKDRAGGEVSGFSPNPGQGLLAGPCIPCTLPVSG